jgi:ATP-dependent Clp protease ATP-binding subunit ClpC
VKKPGIPAGINNFTPRAQQALALAGREARRLNHRFVGVEYVLLGLVALGQGVGVNVIRKMGLNPETLRAEVERIVGAGPAEKFSGQIPYTPRVKKVLALAAEEARKFNHAYIGTEHILLVLIGEGGGVAARVLARFGVDIEQTRVEILKKLDPNFEG